MESIKDNIQIYAPSPHSERSYSTNLSISKDGKWIAYCINDVVIIKSLTESKIVKVFSGHKVKTTSVGWAPSGVFLASGDAEGNLKIFRFDDLSLKKEYPYALGGIIRGIVWNDESNKIFFYGQGKSFLGRVIMWDSGNNTADISGHSKVILSGDIKKTRPYRLITGSEDFKVNFYEATPSFRFSKSNSEHTNFVSCVKYSPDDSLFVSVGFDKKIIIYDGKDGSVLYKIAEDKTENNHNGAIIAVCWINNNLIATTSLDKSVKIWDVKEKSCLYTLYAKKNVELTEMGCGIASNGEILISLSLSGVINYWKVNELSEGKIPDYTFDGHQGNISSILNTEKGIISSDSIGKIIIWDSDYVGRLLHNVGTKVISMCSTSESIYTLDATSNLNILSYEGNIINSQKFSSLSPQMLKVTNNVAYILTETFIYSFSEGKITAEAEVSNAKSLEINEKNKEIYIGNIDGEILVYDFNLKLITKLKHHLNEVSVIKVSHGGNLVASGDAKKNVFIWDSITREILIDRFVYHTAKVFDISWTSDDNFLISGGLDKSIILWNVSEKTKVRVFQEVDNEVVYTLTWINDKEFICGGHSCVLKKYSI